MTKKRALIAFGRAVRQVREQQGMSVESVAAAAGIAAGELEAVEAGRLDPGYRGLLHIPAALGITSTALLRVEELEATPGGEA
jgi:transcriptional regulator with XRE-family HTH domain